MDVLRDAGGEVRSIKLTDAEMRELLSYEATYTCLMDSDNRRFLSDIRKHYDIPEGDMRPYVETDNFTRDDVWRLQILKRSAQANYEAVHIIGDLRRLESELGVGALQTYVDRNRLSP
jgi:hypothetical protein